MKKKKKSLTQLADAAFRQAAQKILERAEQTGTPIIVWKNGAITELDPREVRAAQAKRKRKAK